MKIAILGRTQMLLKTAELLIASGFEIPLVVTAKAAPEYLVTEADFERFSARIGAKYLCTNKINDYVGVLSSCDVDIGVSMNYSSTISEQIVECFKMGILNAHLGDLPKYRGNATPNWAIINGEASIPLCIQYMIGGELDSGDVVNRASKEITDATKIGEIYDWVDEVTPGLYLETLNVLQKNPSHILYKQSRNPMDALRCYPRIPDDSRINWSQSNLQILRLVNASSRPFSGAFCFYGSERLVVDDCELFEDSELYCAMPGQISEINRDRKYVVVITGQGKLKINRIIHNGAVVDPTMLVKSIRTRFV
ncbi:methionyl-tRNA formyltransferase [Bdellovibrio sp. HCB288]|uniref:methionyl-tRNA formyltransferase n=1 Tax=Bdellovibrio sp. HCB288 TaxID=3394355 RepID=UPI0039B5243F